MPFTIPALKIYVYSPNLKYDIELKDKEKNYEKLTIDQFHKKYNFDFIIDEISQNTFLLKSNEIVILKRHNTGIILLEKYLKEKRNRLNYFMTTYSHNWFEELQNLKLGKIKDHKGNRFKSTQEMCDHYGIPLVVFRNRYNDRKFSLEKCLTMPYESKFTETIDHEGNVFNSEAEMCRFHNVKRKTFRFRRENGWSLKDSLSSENHVNKISTDHKGNTFKSFGAMCKHYKMHTKIVRNRLEKGMSLEKALTPYDHTVIDHLGNKFDSTKEMCKYHNINVAAYKGRLKLNWSIEEALTIPVKNGNNQSLRKNNK